MTRPPARRPREKGKPVAAAAGGGPGPAAERTNDTFDGEPPPGKFAQVAKLGGLKIHWRQLRVGSSPTDDKAARAAPPGEGQTGRRGGGR